MELTSFPFWTFTYDDTFKIAGYLSEAQQFVTEHEVSSIEFYINVMCTQPGIGGTEHTFRKRQMTKEELLLLSSEWLAEEMRKAGKEAQEYYFPSQNLDTESRENG